MPKIESTAPQPAPVAGPARGLMLRDRLLAALVLPVHHLAERRDLVPPTFGDQAPVDEADAHAVLGEWRRLARIWLLENPEEVFALKVGSGLLLGVLLLLWVVIRAMF